MRGKSFVRCVLLGAHIGHISCRIISWLGRGIRVTGIKRLGRVFNIVSLAYFSDIIGFLFLDVCFLV